MKTHIFIPILLAVFSLLAACSPLELPDSNTQTSESPTAPITESVTLATTPTTEEPTQPLVPQGPMITVSLPVTTELGKAEDGTVIFSYTFQNISLITQDPDIADIVIIDFLNRIDTTRLNADRIYSMAQSAYAGQSDWSAYMSTISYDPKRVDRGILSLFGTHAGFYGSTHPETVYSAINYDLVTGLPLALGDILSESISAEALQDLILSFLKENEKSLNLFDDYTETVNTHFSSGTIQNSWYFTNNGLCFYFVPYEIAPYSKGVVTAEIPYAQLVGILNDSFFPAEQDTASGSLFSQPFTADSLTRFNRFTEVILDSNGMQHLLYTDHQVRNVRIESGIWSATGSFYTPQYTVFAASDLYPGDALMLQADFSSEYPALRISWETDSGNNTSFLMLNENGSLQLKKP